MNLALEHPVANLLLVSAKRFSMMRFYTDKITYKLIHRCRWNEAQLVVNRDSGQSCIWVGKFLFIRYLVRWIIPALEKRFLQLTSEMWIKRSSYFKAINFKIAYSQTSRRQIIPITCLDQINKDQKFIDKVTTKHSQMRNMKCVRQGIRSTLSTCLEGIKLTEGFKDTMKMKGMSPYD